MSTVPEDRILQRNRMKIYAGICAVLFLMLFARLWYLQIALGNKLLEDSEVNRNRLVRVRAPRGMILDRNGKVLATSRPQYVVLAVPELLESNHQAFNALKDILGLTQKELKKIMSSERAAAYAPVRVKTDVDVNVIAKIMEHRAILPGVDVELDQLRSYPDGALCCHILGYIKEIDAEELKKFNDEGRNYRPGDYVGKSGIERQYESLLRGIDGGERLEVDALGRTRRSLGRQEPIPGATLTLTIDKNLQIAAERAMEGKTGAVVAVDPQTGEVLAMVSKPDYDPNIFVKRVKPDDWNRVGNNPTHPMQNRAISGLYPPGSTFKPVTATASLQLGACTPNTAMSCPGSYHLGRARFGCWKRHGGVNFTTAISGSCDVFFYTVGRKIGIDNLAKYAKQFGLDQPTNIDLPGGRSNSGTIPDTTWKKKNFADGNWYQGETVICSIGQGYVLASPLQMAMVSATVGASGKYYQPHILMKAVRPGKKTDDGEIGPAEVQNIKPKLVRTVNASEKNFKAIQYAMHQTVVGPGGTGHVVDLGDVAVAGKTGSAEVKGKAAHAWFICFAPVDKPRIAIAVISEHGRHGATSAAPVARAILDVYFGKKKPSEIKSSVAKVSGD